MFSMAAPLTEYTEEKLCNLVFGNRVKISEFMKG